MSTNGNTRNQLPDFPESLPEVPPLPADSTLPDITPLLSDQLEEVARTHNGVTLRPNEQPIHVGVASSVIRDPQWRTDTDRERTLLIVQSKYSQGGWVELCLTTETLLELVERAAAQHPLCAPALLSQLYTVRQLFRV